MENVFIKSINQILGKHNFFDTIIKIEKIYDNRENLNIYQIGELVKDLKKIQEFMILNTMPVNINQYKYYYKRFALMKINLNKLTLKKIKL